MIFWRQFCQSSVGDKRDRYSLYKKIRAHTSSCFIGIMRMLFLDEVQGYIHHNYTPIGGALEMPRSHICLLNTVWNTSLWLTAKTTPQMGSGQDPHHQELEACMCTEYQGTNERLHSWVKVHVFHLTPCPLLFSMKFTNIFKSHNLKSSKSPFLTSSPSEHLIP